MKTLYTGYNKIDNILKCIKTSELTFISSRPGVGKTTFALNIAGNISKSGNGVLYIDLDSTKEETRNKMKNIEYVKDKIIIETPSNRVDTIINLIERFRKSDYNNNVVIIDYLELLEKYDYATIEKLKNKAIELDVALVIIYELKSGVGIPTLMELGAKDYKVELIDNVLFLIKNDNLLNVIVAKSKNGKTNNIDLAIDVKKHLIMEYDV